MKKQKPELSEVSKETRKTMLNIVNAEKDLNQSLMATTFYSYVNEAHLSLGLGNRVPKKLAKGYEELVTALKSGKVKSYDLIDTILAYDSLIRSNAYLRGFNEASFVKDNLDKKLHDYMLPSFLDQNEHIFNRAALTTTAVAVLYAGLLGYAMRDCNSNDHCKNNIYITNKIDSKVPAVKSTETFTRTSTRTPTPKPISTRTPIATSTPFEQLFTATPVATQTYTPVSTAIPAEESTNDGVIDKNYDLKGKYGK